MNAENAQLANKRVDHHLEHMGDRVLFGIGNRGHFFHHGTFALDQRFGIAFERVGQQFDEDLQQFLYRADTKQIGIRWPSRNAFSNGA